MFKTIRFFFFFRAKNEMTTLTEAMVLQKARVGSLELMKHLNFWGTDLSDVSIISRMPNLEVVSLSVNLIRTLRHFGQCPNLTEVYIRKNEIASLTELRYLQPLRRLRTLWLSHNPCAKASDYRLRVIRLLPQLTKLDNADITADERKQASSLPEDCDQVEDVEQETPSVISDHKPTPVVQAKPPTLPQPSDRHSPPPPPQSQQQKGSEAFVIPVDSSESQPLREPQSARPTSSSSTVTKGTRPTRASSAGASRRASWQAAISVLPLQGQAAPDKDREKDEPQPSVAAARPLVHREDVLPSPEEEAPKVAPTSREKAAVQKVPHQASTTARPATSAASSSPPRQQDRRQTTFARPISRSSGSNVLRAVLTLLNELDEDALQVVRSEIDSRLLVSAHQQQRPYENDDVL